MSFLTCTFLKGNGLGVSQQNRSVQEHSNPRNRTQTEQRPPRHGATTKAQRKKRKEPVKAESWKENFVQVLQRAGCLGQAAVVLASKQHPVLLLKMMIWRELPLLWPWELSAQYSLWKSPFSPCRLPCVTPYSAVKCGMGTELVETRPGVFNRRVLWSCSEQIIHADVKMPGVKSWPCHINGTHVQRLAGALHKKRTTHAVLAVYREIRKLFQPMSPRFLVPGLNHGRIISRKTSVDWDTQVYKLACASTRTVVGLWERLKIEALLTLSCQLPAISFNIVWTLSRCWKCVKMSETEGLAAKSNSHTSDVEHWELEPTGMEQPATLSQAQGLSPQRDLWESLVLRISFSRGSRIKDNSELSLHHGPARVKN